MREKFEYKGYWYLPSDPDNKVAGILTYIPYECIRLDLFGTFEESAIDFFTSSKAGKDIIWGITSDAHEITLINCSSGGGSYNFSCPFPITKYSVLYCLDGIHIENFVDKRFSWSNIVMPELTIWSHPSAIKLMLDYNENGKPNRIGVSGNYDEIKEPIASVGINESTTLSISRNFSFDESNYRLNPTFQQTTYLQIKKSSKSSISDFISDIALFEQFISLASLSTIKASNVCLFDEENYQELDNNEKILHPIQLFYVQRDLELKKTETPDFLIFYSQIRDIFPEIIKRWYGEESKKMAPIRVHMIKSVKRKNVFDSTDFLIVIQAIEGFCTRFRKEQNLSKMLEDITFEFNDIVKVKQSKIDIKATVDSRHYYSHFMEPSKKPNKLDGIDLFNLTEKLRVLLICCLLNFVGIKNERINELLNKSNNSRLE